MLSKLYSLARIGAGVIVLSASGFVAQAANAPAYDPDALRLAISWEKIKFLVEDPDEQRKQMDGLGEQADALAEQRPDAAEVVIWDRNHHQRTRFPGQRTGRRISRPVRPSSWPSVRATRWIAWKRRRPRKLSTPARRQA